MDEKLSVCPIVPVCSPFLHVPQPIVADQHECQAGHDNSPLLSVRCKIQFRNFSSRNFFTRGARRHTCTRCQYLASGGSTGSTITADKHCVARDARPVPGGASL